MAYVYEALAKGPLTSLFRY